MKKIIVVILSAALAVSVLAGCGGSSGSASDSNLAAEEAAEPAAEEAEELTDDEAAEPAGGEDISEPAEEAAAVGQTDSTAQADMGEEADTDQTLMRSPSGDIASAPGLSDVNEFSSDEVAEMDKAMRAYTPPADSPLINNAKNFYYYSQMNEVERRLYDAMLMCASDPTTPDAVAAATMSMDPASEDFRKELNAAYWGMQYDHPELFWLNNGPFSDGAECSMQIGYCKAPESDGTYNLYFWFPKPFGSFEERMEEFNNAVDTFMADIDLSQSDDQIALQIHDKLIHTVDFNYKYMTEDEGAGNNIVQTAYAALVKDAHDTPTCATSGGYAQAYVYLLQQAGIDAAVIVGSAGSTEKDEYMGGHAWTIVKLDDEWYETDPAWNDFGDLNMEIYEDVMFSLEHGLYNLTTEEMTEGKSNSSDQAYDLGDSYVHYRANDERALMPSYSKLMDLAPQAAGTKYKLH